MIVKNSTIINKTKDHWT